MLIVQVTQKLWENGKTLKSGFEGENGKIVCGTTENASHLCVQLLFPEF